MIDLILVLSRVQTIPWWPTLAAQSTWPAQAPPYYLNSLHHMASQSLLQAAIPCVPSPTVTCPSNYHYHCLKWVAKYLRATSNWGIRYKRIGVRTDLEDGTFKEFKKEDGIPDYPEDITRNKLICFVDAAYGNDYKNRRSTT